MWKKSILASFKVLSQRLLGTTKEIHERYPDSRELEKGRYNELKLIVLIKSNLQYKGSGEQKRENQMALLLDNGGRHFAHGTSWWLGFGMAYFRNSLHSLGKTITHTEALIF
jgi:hypothetical protein